VALQSLLPTLSYPVVLFLSLPRAVFSFLTWGCLFRKPHDRVLPENTSS
jgi:hypothetical protein